MEQNLLTAIIYDEDDANLFLKLNPLVNRILPITPNARAILLECGVPLISTLEIYTDYRQAKVLARVRRTERELLSVLENEKNLGIASKETIRGIVHVLCSISASFWELVKDIGHCLLTDGKQWIRINDSTEIHKCLLNHLQPLIKRSMIPIIAVPVFPLTVKILNIIALSFWKGKSTIFFSDYNYGLNKLRFNKMFAPYSLSIRSADGGWRDLILSIKFLLDSLFFKKTVTIVVNPSYSNKTANASRRVLNTINDSISRIVINLVQDSFIDKISLYDGSKEDISRVIDKLRPHQIISGHLRWWTPTFVAEVGKKNKIPVTLITHGTHSLPDTAIASFEQEENIHGLMISPLSDISLLQSPHAEACAMKIGCNNGQRSRPIQWGINAKPITSSNSSTKYILHAGSYKTWVGPRPWIYETPDEFINGLTSLILATSNLNNTKLIIRIRPQPDCNIKNLRKLLPKFDHFEIKSSGSFFDDMYNADLLVSWASTTIEEALHLRKPVLLWGGSNRYFHLPPCHEFPTPQNRSAVYAPEKEEDLPQMIESVLESHASKPLTNEELKSHVWSKNIPGIDEFAKQLSSNSYNTKYQ